MYAIINFVFSNIFLITFIFIVYYVVKNYKILKEYQEKVNSKFTETLNKYITDKINEAKEIVKGIEEKYKDDEIKTELSKLHMIFDRDFESSINTKVDISNSLNKFRLNKNLDLEKYPDIVELNKIGTFTETDMNSLDNGVAIARREYNTLAFRYNEKASGFPIQYLTKILGLVDNYIIFDTPKSKFYELNYEAFEEEEPEINSITSLNQKNDEEEKKEYKPREINSEKIIYNYNSGIVKPNFTNEEEKNNK